MVSQMLTLSTKASARGTAGKTFWNAATRWSPDTTRGAERRLGDCAATAGDGAEEEG